MEDRAKARSALEALEDLLASEAEWRGLPSVVRVAFQASCALARHSAAVSDGLAAELAAKADKEDMKKAFKFKANLVDVEESLEKVAEVLETKVSVEDLEGVLADYVRNDEYRPADFEGEADGRLQSRVEKLEDMAFALEADASDNYTKNFVTRSEFHLLEETVHKCCRSADLDQLKKAALTRQDLDKVISNELLPDLADQMRDIQHKTKAKLEELIQELESRVNVDDFSAIRRDIERLLTDKETGDKKVSLAQSLDAVRSEVADLEERLASLEALPGETASIRKDIQSVAVVNREIQDNLHKISRELENLPVTARVKEMDSHLNTALKSLDAKVKRLESADRRTQEILEILSKSKLKDNRLLDEEGPDASNRSGSLVGPLVQGGQPLIEQVNEIKSYVDKRIRKVEALHARQEDLDKLEDKVEDAETTHNHILDSLKEMISDLNAKLKSNCRFLEDKIEQQAARRGEKAGKEAAKASTKARLNDSSKTDVHNRSQSSADKLRSLDSLIQKVSGLVDKRAKDDEWRLTVAEQVEAMQAQMKEKADKVKICKLIDRKAGRC